METNNSTEEIQRIVKSLYAMGEQLNETLVAEQVESPDTQEVRLINILNRIFTFQLSRIGTNLEKIDDEKAVDAVLEILEKSKGEIEKSQGQDNDNLLKTIKILKEEIKNENNKNPNNFPKIMKAAFSKTAEQSPLFKNVKNTINQKLGKSESLITQIKGITAVITDVLSDLFTFIELQYNQYKALKKERKEKTTDFLSQKIDKYSDKAEKYKSKLDIYQEFSNKLIEAKELEKNNPSIKIY